jgi:hypothetical protein
MLPALLNPLPFSLQYVMCTQPDCPLTDLPASTNGNVTLDYHQDNRLYYRRLIGKVSP